MKRTAARTEMMKGGQNWGVKVSMAGRGRWMDNRFIERLWRSVKDEDIYLNDYGEGLAAGRGFEPGV